MTHSLLFIDDEAPLLSMMREFFVARGFLVDAATELEEAMALLDCREYSLVVCDISLKGVRDAEGLEIVSYIRSFSPSTKIVILTACRSSAIRHRSFENDVDCFLVKPQPLWSLAAVLDCLLTEADTAHADPSR